jgi:hypothetical protein
MRYRTPSLDSVSRWGRAVGGPPEKRLYLLISGMATLLFRAIGPEPPHNGRSGSALLQSLPGRSGCIDDRPIDGANTIFLLKSGNLRRGVDRAGLAVTVSSWWPGRPREKGRQTRYLACVRPAFFDATPVEWGLIANNQAPYKTAADLIAAAKAAPGKIDYGSGGPGSPQHLAMAMFASAAGISLTRHAGRDRHRRRADPRRLSGFRDRRGAGARRSA